MPLPYQWRVTRYDPTLRNAQGHYPLGDWCFFAQVGKVFSGEELTYERYLFWETAYANAALAFLSDAHLDTLRVVTNLASYRLVDTELRRHYDAEELRDISLAPKALHIGALIGQEDLGDVIRLNLRDLLWCKLETGSFSGLKFYLHFGWDFYMFIGTTSPSTEAIRYAKSLGLFVEPMKSPYSPQL